MTQEIEGFHPTEQSGRISREHVHRYARCRHYVAGLRVLDTGCGAGYGTGLLSGVAASTAGGSIGDMAICGALQRYGTTANRDLCADCYGFPFEDGSFDADVANDIIENVDDRQVFVAEAPRLLKPNGLFLVSTPNKPVSNHYKPPCAYPFSEMDVPEFRATLRSHFPYIRLTRARMSLASASFVLDTSEVADKPAIVSLPRGSAARSRARDCQGRTAAWRREMHLGGLRIARTRRSGQFLQSVLFMRRRVGNGGREYYASGFGSSGRR